MSRPLQQPMLSEFIFHLDQIPAYNDLLWDTMPQKIRENYALAQAKNTAIFAKENVPFYTAHFRKISIDDMLEINSLEEFATTLPELTKEHLSQNSFEAFLPKSTRIFDYGMRNYGTGGTTGKPVTIWHSESDWEAMAQHIARSINYDFKDNTRDLANLAIQALYHGDHITAHIYRAGLRQLGMQVVGRVSTKQSIEQNYNFLQELKPNGILAPPESKGEQTKGITLDGILRLDSKNKSKDSYRLNNSDNPDFKIILWSSMPLSIELYDYLKNHLKIPYIQGQYGSTECCPTGATCSARPLDFHLGYGPTLINAVHPFEKRLIKENEIGYLLVTKTGGVSVSKKNIVPTGTCLINFRTGDYAKLENISGQACSCGRTTPILTNLQRIENKDLKAMFGCQSD